MNRHLRSPLLASVAILSLIVALPLGHADSETWTGSVSNVWNTATANWSGGNGLFADGDSVTFSGGSNTNPISVSGTVRPGAIDITTTGGPFSFSGGTIRFDTSGNNAYSFGAAALTLNGGTLWFNFTGGARPGTVSLTSPLAVGSSGGTLDLIQTGSSANVNFTNTLTLDGGTLTVKGQSVTDRSYLTFNLQNTVTLAQSSTINYDSQYYSPGTGLTHNVNVISGTVSGPTKTLTLGGTGYVTLNNGGANFDVAGLTINGSSKILYSGGANADFLSAVRGHTPTGGVTINAGNTLAVANGGHWRWSDFSLGSNAGVTMAACDVLYTWDQSFTVGSGQSLTWNQYRNGGFSVGDAGNALTVGNGGRFQVNSVRPNNDCNVDFRAKLTLLGGATLEGLVDAGLSDNPTKACGIIQQNTAGSRLILGDGSAATAETITIQGIDNYVADRNRNVVIGIDSGNVTDDGNVVLKYVSLGTDPSKYFNIEWSNTNANKTVQPFRGGSAGTEFAPGVGNAGIAAVGPSTDGVDIMTITAPTTLTTAGTVGFYKAGSASATGFYVSRSSTLGSVLITSATGSLTLQAAGTVSASAITVEDGGRLGGVGTVKAPVTVGAGGTHAPGLSPGIQNVVGDYTLDGATLELEIEGPTAGDGAGFHDQVNVTGTVTLLNDPVLDIISVSGISLGDVLTIIANDDTDPVSGIFLGLSEGTKFALLGQKFVISYLGGSGNDVTLAPIPEPATLAVFGLAGLGLLRRPRRRA